MKNCIKLLSTRVVIIAGVLCMLNGCASNPIEKKNGSRETPPPIITEKVASSMSANTDKEPLIPATPSIKPTNTPVLKEITATPKPLTAIPTPKVTTLTPDPVTKTPVIKTNTPTPKVLIPTSKAVTLTPKAATPTSKPVMLTPTSKPVTATPIPTITPELIVVYEMLDMVNEARTEEGLTPYTWSTKLEQICKERMTEILHNYQTGADPHDGCRTSGEDIAVTAVAERAFELWMNSEAHRSIIMSDATEDTYLDPSWEIWERVTCYNKDGVKYYAGDTIPGNPMAMACVGYDGIWVLVTEHRPGYF